MTSEQPAAEHGEKADHRNGAPWRLRVLLRWARRALTHRLSSEEAREIRRSVEAEGRFSERYALLCALSAGIATLGLLQSSPAVVIGAMLVSPLMGPIAALGFAFASIDGRRIRDAAQVVALGALVGVGVGVLITLLSPIRNATPEIIARTAPTLLDLAVALLSGLAGGYATVHRKGETAIGVAIATALMPPLAAIGYSLAVLRFDFAAGAGLLFLTNLAAISFSFALVARQRGVARPLSRVEFKPVHVVLGVLAFLLLATPLALTLRRVTQEAFAAAAARREIMSFFEVDRSQIAQLAVTWRNLDPPEINATVVTPAFRADAEATITRRLTQSLRTQPDLSVSQVVATDVAAQTQALIDAALRNQAAQAALAPPQPQPPLQHARAASIFPIEAAWVDPETQTIHLSAVALTGVRLADYRREEERLDALVEAWRVEIVPPFQERLFIPFPSGSDAPDYASQDALQDALWALSRWNARRVGLEGLAGRRSDASQALRDLAMARVAAVSERMAQSGIDITPVVAERAVTETLYASGGDARVTGVDIRVRPATLRRAPPAPAQQP